MPTPPTRRVEGTADPNGALIAFFRTKLGKEADDKLIAFLEKSGNQELPAGLVKPALSLLGISGDLASLSDAQVLDCVERNSRSLLKDLQDFKAGDKQVVADRAKTILARLAISLQSVARIREGIKSPAPIPRKAVPLASAPAPLQSSPAISVSTRPAAGTKRPSSSLGLGAIAMVLCGVLAAVAIGGGIAWSVWGRQSAAVPAKAQVTPPSTPTQESKTLPQPQEKAVPVADAEKRAIATAVAPNPSKPAPAVPENVARKPPEPTAGVAKEDGPSKPITTPPEKNRGELSDLAQGKPAEIKKVEIDKQEFDRMRASLRDAVKETANGEKVDAILAFATDPEIAKSPAATKAVLAEALVQSLTTKDLRRAQETLSRIRDSLELFGEDEYRASLGRVKDLAATSGNRVLAFELIDELRQREALSPQDALAEKAALLRAAAGDKALKKPASLELRQELAGEMVALAIEGADLSPDISEGLLTEARKTVGTISNRERRAAFEKEMSAAKAVVAEGKRYQQAQDQLAKEPGDAAARKVRVEILVSRGKAKEVLAELAAIDHPLQSLAKETDTLLKQGAEAGGKECFACSQRWAKAATESEGAKKAGLQKLASELTALAISAKNNPLDPFALQKAKQQEESLADAQRTYAGSAKTAVDKSLDAKVAAKLKRAVNLLTSEDIKVNMFQGKAEKVQGTLLGEQAVLEFGTDLAGQTYRLRSAFVRTSGNDTVGYTFPVGKSSVSLILGGWGDKFIGLFDIPANETHVSATRLNAGLQNNQLYSVQIDVVQASDEKYQIVVHLDGKKIIDWLATPDTIAAQPDYVGTSKGTLVIGARHSNFELRGLELSVAEGKPTRKERGPGKAGPWSAFAGKWKVTYEEGHVRNYQIDEKGNVFFLEENWNALLSKKGADILVDFKDGKLERFTMVDGVLVVEHFNPASRYPDSPNFKGKGVRE
jgi:hypothetical protein